MSSLPTSQNLASHRRSGNGFKSDASWRRTRFFDSASAFAADGYGGRAATLKMTTGERAAYRGVRSGRMFASYLIALNPLIKPAVVDESELSCPPLKNIGVFEVNLGD